MTKKDVAAGLSSTILLVFLWRIAAESINSPFILPDPVSVVYDFFIILRDTIFIKNIVATCTRGVAAFGISFILSAMLGIMSGISKTIASAISPWMTLIKSTPVVSFILIALLWFGSSIVPIFVSVLMTLPVMTEAIAQGVRSTDTKLLEMSYVYQFSSFKRLLYIRIPSALPFFLAGSGSSLGLTWKVVVAGEILSSPRFGIGSAMQSAKVQLETVRVFSLTATAIFLSLITDFLFQKLVEVTRRHETDKEPGK